MKTWLLFAAVLLLLALDWAALHDIVKGNETDYSLEYGMLTASAPVLGALIVSVWRQRSKRSGHAAERKV